MNQAQANVENAAFRRKNPLTGEWVLVSPHRNNRPWSGANETVNDVKLPDFDKSCPLCPGNQRANGEVNPHYRHTFVFQNDFAALTDKAVSTENPDSMFVQSEALGEARVICFSPYHNKTLPLLSDDEMLAVVNTWKSEYESLSQRYECVQIFENKGEIMGCSQPHPHGQIWAHQHLATEVEKEHERQQTYYKENGEAMLAAYAKKELALDERVVVKNDHWLVVVPYWAKWPFETLVLPLSDVSDFSQLDDKMASSLAQILKLLTIKYDNIFNTSFPYSMGWHTPPSSMQDKSAWRLHAHFYPPLLRSATVKKHMVGYEMMGESQRDLTPELAAKIIRETADVHYSVNASV